MAVGASTVSYRDHLDGTILGLGVLVIAHAAFGYQFTKALSAPSPTTWIIAALFVGVPLTLALLLNRLLRRTRPAA